MNRPEEWTYIHDPSLRNEFFGEVKHRLSATGECEVELVVRPDPDFGFELSMAALAIDGSRSMMQPYAAALPKMLQKKKNVIHPICQELASFLAKNAKGQCAVANWACGDDGGDIEPVGMMNSEDIAGYYFKGPEHWGGGTKLTPIVQYFWEQVFAGTDKVGVAAILTDGAWDDEDHEQVLQLTQVMCDEIAAGRRQLMKTVILGLKTDVNASEIERIEHRFNSLDDFESGTDIDVWDHKWIDDMDDFIEIFIEMVKELSLGVGGYIEAGGTKVLERDEFDFGIQFKMPGTVNDFVLHLEGVDDYQQTIP